MLITAFHKNADGIPMKKNLVRRNFLFQTYFSKVDVFHVMKKNVIFKTYLTF